jgi:hypothetical protein
MAGGTLCSTEKGFTVRVPELRSSTTLAVTRCEKHGKAVLCLDNAFSLIEGSPVLAAYAQTKLLRFPNVHGDKVVFTYAGDL